MPTVSKIDDPHDARLDPFRLVRERDLRGRDHLFLAESEMVLRRLLRTPERLHSVLLTAGHAQRLANELAALPEFVPVLVADLDLMTDVAGFHVHRGVLAAGIRPRPDELDPRRALAPLASRASLRLVLAEGVTNVDNIGALFRNAAAFGADGVMLDDACADPLYRKAIRVSMGHVLAMPWAISRAWYEDLAWMKREFGVTLVASEVTSTSRAVWDLSPMKKVAIIFGSEAFGVDPLTLGRCDVVACVPMAEGVPSLNIAVAGAVMMYEVFRRPAAAPPRAEEWRETATEV